MSTEQNVMPRQSFAGGEVIFKEGMFGDVAYVVQSGEVEIAKTASNGKRKVLGYIRNGGMFGEMALIDGRPRMATATVTKPATLLVIRRDIFEKKVNGADPFVKGLLRILVRNVRSLADDEAAATAGEPAGAPAGSPPTPA